MIRGVGPYSTLITPQARALFHAVFQPRGLRGVKLVIWEAHEGLKTAIAKVLHASWQRCRVPFMRNVLAYAGTSRAAASSPPLSAPRLFRTRPRRRALSGARACPGEGRGGRPAPA